MVVNVLELITTPFTERDHDAQVQIVKEGRPRPAPTGAIFDNCPGGIDLFNQVKWLTCYEKEQDAFMFCWPCLLFTTQATLWNRGILNLTYAFENLWHHEREAEHLDAVFKLKIFAMQFAKPRLVIDRMRHNDLARRNVAIFRRITEAVCSFVKLRSKCSDSHKGNLLDINDCFQFLDYRSAYKGIMEDVHWMSDFPKLLYDLVDVITIVIKNAVVNEAKNSSYVSVILSQHATGLLSQISTVLRYIKDGNVCERFIGFTDSLYYFPSYHNVCSLVLNTLKRYGITDKFLSLSVDGAVLPRTECNDLESWLQSRSCKLPFLVPCNFHSAGHVLLDSMLHFEECVQFFTAYREIEQFFHTPSNMRAFQHVLKVKVPALKMSEWYGNPPFMLLLCTYRKQFLEYLTTCIAVNRLNQTSDSAAERTFKNFLEDKKTVFLLMLFHKIFSGFFDQQFNFLSTSSTVKHTSEMISQLNSKIIEIYTLGFPYMWGEVMKDIFPDSWKVQPIKTECEHLFQKVLNHLIQETNLRATNLLRLSFCDMLACDARGRIPFKDCHVSKLSAEMGSDIDVVGFNNEIKVAKGVVTPIFNHKSLYTLLRAFVDNDLMDVFPQFYKVNELILTLPLFPAISSGPTKTHTKLQDIQDFTYVPAASRVSSGDISVLCVERHYLEELQQSESFYQDVIEQYRQLNTDLVLDQV